MARLIKVSKLQAQMLSRVGVATVRVTRIQPVTAEDEMEDKSKQPVVTVSAPPQVENPRAQRRVPQSLNRLEQAEYFKLYKWIEAVWSEISKEPGILRATIAQRATGALGFTITEHHIFGALKSMGLELPGVKRVVKTDEAVKTLAQTLLMLISEIPLLAAKVPQEIFDAVKELS